MKTMREAALLLGTVTLLATACGSSTTSSTPTTTTVPVSTTTTTTTTTEVGAQGTPDAAIGAWMAAKGHRYVGECAKATMSQVPSECSILRADRADVKIFEAGPIFSEPTNWLLVRRTASGWAVVDSAPRGTAPGVSNQPPW